MTFVEDQSDGYDNRDSCFMKSSFNEELYQAVKVRIMQDDVDTEVEPMPARKSTSQSFVGCSIRKPFTPYPNRSARVDAK